MILKYIITIFLLKLILSANEIYSNKVLTQIFPIILDDIIIIVKVPKRIPTLPPVKTYLKKTGQIESYNQEGDQVARGSIKDDGYYKKGLIPNYIRNFTLDTVSDYITELQWQDNVLAHGSWLAAKNYCSDLTIGGYYNWRLPTSKELYGLVEYRENSYFINTIFYSVIYGNYWSSTYIIGYDNFVWTINFSNGDLEWGNIWQNYYVRCVRNK